MDGRDTLCEGWRMSITDDMEKALLATNERVRARLAAATGGADLAPEQAFAAIWDLEGEINSGGFSGYLFNSAGDDAALARETLEAIGATESLAVFDDFLALLPGGSAGATQDDRQEQLDRMNEALGEDEVEERLGALDQRFYATQDDLRARLFAFASAKLPK